MTVLDKKVSHYLDRYGSASKSVQEKDTIALTVDHNKIMFQLVDVPKENHKEKKQIIEWARKRPPFPIEESILSIGSGGGNSFHVGIGESSSLDSICGKMKELEYDLRSLYPIAQSIYNAFIWNYPEKSRKIPLSLTLAKRIVPLLVA